MSIQLPEPRPQTSSAQLFEPRAELLHAAPKQIRDIPVALFAVDMCRYPAMHAIRIRRAIAAGKIVTGIIACRNPTADQGRNEELVDVDTVARTQAADKLLGDWRTGERPIGEVFCGKIDYPLFSFNHR